MRIFYLEPTEQRFSGNITEQERSSKKHLTEVSRFVILYKCYYK